MKHAEHGRCVYCGWTLPKADGDRRRCSICNRMEPPTMARSDLIIPSADDSPDVARLRADLVEAIIDVGRAVRKRDELADSLDGILPENPQRR